MKIISARVQADLDKKLRHEAKQERVSVSDILRRILLRHYGLVHDPSR